VLLVVYGELPPLVVPKDCREYLAARKRLYQERLGLTHGSYVRYAGWTQGCLQLVAMWPSAEAHHNPAAQQVWS
jgi:hypothetical protein